MHKLSRDDVKNASPFALVGCCYLITQQCEQVTGEIVSYDRASKKWEVVWDDGETTRETSILPCAEY